MNIHAELTDNINIPSSSSCCFFCAIKNTDSHLRHTALKNFFTIMPIDDNPENVLVMSTIWSIAMSHPSDPYLPSLGALSCATSLISRALADPVWLGRHQNVYIPYYAAHILGSYTLRLPSLAVLSVNTGAVTPLLALLRGSLTWVEQRVAVRAIGHIASYSSTFPAVACHAEELVVLSVCLATTIHATVYTEFTSLRPHRRRRYHRDLLSRGLGDADIEVRRAEEWASQTQIWSLKLLSCLAFRHRASHGWICGHISFLNVLSRLLGCPINSGASIAAAGLLRILCRGGVGRQAVAGCTKVVQSLCSLSRSPDEWQYIGIDCLLLLLDDPNTRHKVLPIAAQCLVDLSELQSIGPRRGVGDTIANCLLRDFDIINNEAVSKLWKERKSKRVLMSAEAVEARKLEGNQRFWAGDMEGAVVRYTVALDNCPSARQKERMILFSNRAQCRLMMREPDRAISDATRALSLVKGHGKSLWRRAQAYDMKGMWKESLMDCMAFVRSRVPPGEVPYFVVRLIHKQMKSAARIGIFVRKFPTRNGNYHEREFRCLANTEEQSRRGRN